MRIRAIVKRIAIQFIRDKRTLGLLLLVPLIVLTLMYLVFAEEKYELQVGTALLPAPMLDQLKEGELALIPYDNLEAAEAALAKQEISAYLWEEDGVLHVKLEGSERAKNRAVLMQVKQSISPPHMEELQTEYLHGGENMSTFDNVGPLFIGVFVFFFVFLIAGVSFLKERTSGTLERLLATPIRRWELVIGYLLGFGVFASLQSALIAGYSTGVLGLTNKGSILYVLLITLVLAVNALSLGTFFSAFAHTEFQMVQFIPLVIVPQVFFSGLIELETIAPSIRWVAHFMPLKYGADALRAVMIRGEGWDGIATQIYVLLGFSLLFVITNVRALRKHRKV